MSIWLWTSNTSLLVLYVNLYKSFIDRIDTTYNKRFFTWTTSTGMNEIYSKVLYLICFPFQMNEKKNVFLEQSSGGSNSIIGNKQHW